MCQRHGQLAFKDDHHVVDSERLSFKRSLRRSSLELGSVADPRKARGRKSTIRAAIIGMRFEREMPSIQQVYLSCRIIALVGLRSCRDERRIVPA